VERSFSIRHSSKLITDPFQSSFVIVMIQPRYDPSIIIPQTYIPINYMKACFTRQDIHASAKINKPMQKQFELYRFGPFSWKVSRPHAGLYRLLVRFYFTPRICGEFTELPKILSIKFAKNI